VTKKERTVFQRAIVDSPVRPGEVRVPVFFMAKRKNKTEVVQGSGNVFADLGVPNAEEKQTKVRLAVAINHILQNQELSQVTAARRLKINQPKVSALSNYRLEGFSVERPVVGNRDEDGIDLFVVQQLFVASRSPYGLSAVSSRI
jgi:predicted XRE-type DNA-binding protein